MTTKELGLLAFEITKEFTPKEVYSYFNSLLGEERDDGNDSFIIDDGLFPDSFPETDNWSLNISVEGGYDYKIYGQHDYEEYVFDGFNGIKAISVYEVSWDTFDGVRHTLSKEEMTKLETLLKEIY